MGDGPKINTGCDSPYCCGACSCWEACPSIATIDLSGPPGGFAQCCEDAKKAYVLSNEIFGTLDYFAGEGIGYWANCNAQLAGIGQGVCGNNYAVSFYAVSTCRGNYDLQCQWGEPTQSVFGCYPPCGNVPPCRLSSPAFGTPVPISNGGSFPFCYPSEFFPIVEPFFAAKSYWVVEAIISSPPHDPLGGNVWPFSHLNYYISQPILPNPTYPYCIPMLGSFSLSKMDNCKCPCDNTDVIATSNCWTKVGGPNGATVCFGCDECCGFPDTINFTVS